FYDLALDWDRRFPVKADRTVGDDIFLRTVNLIRNRVVSLGPVRGEDVVGSPAEEEIEGMPQLLAHGIPDHVVEVAHRPATELEISRCILLGPTGSLHYAVERDEGQYDELSHLRQEPPCYQLSALRTTEGSRIHRPGRRPPARRAFNPRSLACARLGLAGWVGLSAASSDPRSARRQLSSLRTSRSLRAKASGW